MIPRNILLSAALVLAASLHAQTDTTPPSVPANLAGTAASATSTILYWTQAEDGTAVTGYDIHRDGSFLLTHSDNTFTDTGLAPGSAHTYRIAARDAAGNTSAVSPAVTVTTDAAENPRLVRAQHLTYLGAFAFPRDAQNNYAYGGTSIGFNPANNSLFARGHDWYQLVGEISIPSPVITSDFAALPVATALQNLTDVSEGHLNEVGAGGSVITGCKVGGLFVYGDRLIGTSYAYYDAGGSARRSHFTSGLDLAQAGDFAGMYTVGTYNPGFVAGGMAHIPPEWQTALGGPVLTGLDGVPIVSRTSYGPTATVFDPAKLGAIDPVPARLLVGYTYEHSTLGTWGNSTEINPQFNQAAGSSGLVFPFGSDSVLFFGSSGIGVPHYGQGTSDPALHLQPVPSTNGAVVYVYDPASGGKGCHAYPYVAYVWAYRAQDLARVAAGSAQPWEMVPYAMWTLDLPFGPDGQDSVAGAAYDPATNRIFLCQYNAVGASPIIHVYRVDLPAPPDTYATWRAAHWAGADLADDAISGPLADPDRCGLTNLARYAFALPARGPIANPVAIGNADTAAGRVLTLTFPRRATATDLSYTLEASIDLVSWAPVPGQTYAPGSGPITAQDAMAMDEASRRFLRLRITTP
ncbi:MAG: fibronectin type III domain-containing protein [Opitutaceae bacterium]|nr:fibronectin type III domain-containing protein [Opitutaceae bacterium]